MAKEFVIKHGLIVHGEITGSDIRIDDWNSVSASLSELSSNVGETVTTASISGNVITFTKSDGTTFETVVQEDTGSFFTSASVDLNTITFHYGNNESGSLSVETGTTQIRVKNTSGSPITKGTPVYITGNVGNTDMLQIAAADASDLTKMPAVGLLLADLSNNGEGYVIQGGYLKGLVTDTIDGTSTTSNDTVYVKAGGGLTMTKPTGDTNYIQNIAKVARVHGSAGSLVVSSILRTNDVPNLPTGKIWVGNGTTVTSSFVHLDETNQRFGIGTDTPLKPLHIDNDSVPIRLESDTHNAVVVNYRTDEVGTGNGIQIGAKGQSDFFVQQDITTGGASQWNVNVYVSQSGKVYLPNLDGGLQDQILYYNNETGELTPGAQPDTGSFFTSASVDYNRVTFTSGDGTTATITIDTGSFEPDRQDTGSFFTSASVNLNTITFQYGASGTSGSLTIDTGSNFISNVVLDPSPTGSSLIFTGEGGAFNGAVDMSKAYQQGGGMTLNYSGSVLFNAASEWSGGNPNRKVSSTVTSMRDSGWNEWRFSDISRNFSSQYHNNAYNESVFDLITSVVNHTGQLIVRVYDDRNSAYEGFYMNSGSATIKNNANGAGDLSLYLKHIGGRGWGATSGTPGNNTINNTNVAFSFTGTQLYESGSQSQSAFNEASVTSNVVTLTRDDGTTEVLTIDTGSAVTTDISALNTFTGSIQTEVDSLNSVTGSFIVDGTATGNTITFTLEDRSTFNLTIDTGSQVSPDTPLNTFQFNSSGEFGGSTLYFDDTTKQVGVNIDVPRATFHVRGANNGTGSLLIETDSVGGAESGFAKLDFRVADNDGGAFKKFAIIAENEGGGTNEANYGLGQLHFALNNDITMANAKIADSKLTLDHEGNIYMPDIDTGTTLNTIYYNTTSGELTYGLAPTGSGGGSVPGGTVSGSIQVDHDATLNFVANEHIDHSTITIGSGRGLAGGGTIDTNRSLALDTGSAHFLDGVKEKLNIEGVLSGSVSPAGNNQELQFNDNGAFGASQYLTYNGKKLTIDSQDSAPVLKLDASLSDAGAINLRAENTINNGIQVGVRGENNFFVQQDATSGGASNWNVNLVVSQSGELYLGNISNQTTSNILYYNSTTKEVTSGPAPSGGGTDTNIGNTDLSLSANRTLDFNGNGLTFDILQGETFNIAAESNATVGIALDNSEFQITGLASSTTANVLGIDASGNIKTMNTSSFTGGGGGSGTVNTGVAGYLAYYPSNGTTVDDQTGLYWDESSGELGIGTANPARPLHIDSANAVPIRLSSTGNNRQVIQYFGGNSNGAGVLVGTEGENDFIVLQSDFLTNTVNTNLYVSESGETYLPRLAADATPSDIVYYDSSTGELSYGSAPSGGSGETYDLNVSQASTSVILNLDSTSGADDSSIQLDAGTGITLTRNASSRFTIASSGGGGSTSPGGSTTQVQFNNAGSFGGDAGLVYDSASDRLGIGGTGTPSTTLHLAKDSTPLYLDGTTATEATQYIQIEPNGSPGDGVRLGAGYSSPNTDFEIDYHDGSSWDTNFRLAHNGALELPNLGADAGSTTSILYYNTSDGRVTYGSVPSGGGSGTPGGSTTQVQFNDGGSFGGDAGFVYDSTNDRLGIGGTGTPASTLHLAKGDTPLFLDGTTATEATQYIRVKPNGETNSGIRFGAGYASTTQTSFHIGHHSGTWTDILTLRGSNGALTLSGYSGTNLPSSANDYVLAANGSGNVVKMPFTYTALGRYGIGTTTPTSGKLQVQGNVAGVSIYASHDIVAYSDARSKVNIETIPDALEKVNAVRGVTYNKVDDPEGMKYMGVIAQELLEHLPEVVHQGEEGNYSVAYGNVVGVLIEAVKELTAKVEDLESRLGK